MPPRLHRLPNLFAFGGIALLAAFTWIEKGPSRALQWPWHLYAQLLAVLPLLWLLAQVLASGRLRRFGGLLDFGLPGFAVALTGATLASPYRDTALAMLPTGLVPIATAYALNQWLGDADSSRRVAQVANHGGLFLAITSVIALGGWVATYVLPALAAGAPLFAVFGGRNEWLLGHSVYTAALALLCITWLGGLAFERSGRNRLLCILGSMLGLLLLFTAGSRSGFIGLAVWSCWLLWTETRRRRWSLRRTATMAALVLAAFTTIALLHPRSRVILREWRDSGTINMGDRQRLAMAEFGAIALHEHPLLGFGPGTTPQVYPAYRARLSGGVEAALQLHSTPVQWLADAGLPALIAAALAGVALWWRRRHAPASFASGALLAYAALALTDYQLDLPLFSFSVGALVALCAHFPETPASPPLPARTTALSGVLIAAALAAYGFGQVAPLRARASFCSAIEALSAGDRAGFDSGMTEAHRLAPRNAYYLNVHACILADVRTYPAWFPPVDLGPDRLARAIACLRRSLEIDPPQELPRTHLAWHLLGAAPAEALEHFCTAAALIPDKGSLYFGQALAQLRLGKPDAAVRALAMELVNDPDFVTSPEWVQLNEIPGLASAARQTAARELARLADRAPPADPLRYARRARYAAALLRWIDGDDSALAPATGECEPDHLPMLRWLTGQPVDIPAVSAAPWHYLAQASGSPSQAKEILTARYGTRPPLPGTLDALASLLATSDRRTLLRGEACTDTSLQPRIYRERIAYPLLMRNLDAPAPRDPYVVPINRLVRDFLAGLFPDKGYLPGPVLIEAQRGLGLGEGNEGERK